MEKKQRLSQIIQESRDVDSLIKEMLVCIEGMEQQEIEELLKQIQLKLNKFKDEHRKPVRSSLRRSIHSQRLAAMGQMAAAISHELRNPLSGIKVAAEYLMRKLKNQPEAMDAIVNIHNEVIFANNIIANILEHARIGLPQLQKASIKRIIEEAILTASQQGSFNNINIDKEISRELPVLYLDEQQIRQVFMNLFINSAEAMIGGGTLTVKAWHEGNDVIVEAADTGTGIEKSHLEKLFEPFFSTKVKGVGLGLAITKEIINNHKGTIEAESKLGKGTLFRIILPVGKTSKRQRKKNRNR